MNIERLAELEKAATPGPWYTKRDDDELYIVDEFAGRHYSVAFLGDKDDADAELIAALRNAAPELLAVVKAADIYVTSTLQGRGSLVMAERFSKLREALRALDATGGGE